MEKVSVIIPNYNHGEYLEQTIKSVLEQTFPVYEIVVCDDGSVDNSKEVVLKFHNDKIRWIDCGKNGRPAIPRNIGIAQSKGDWIAFLDSDDKWMPNKLELQILIAREKGVKAICCNAIKVNPNTQMTTNLYLQDISGFVEFKRLVNSNLIICSSTLINKQLLDLEGNFPERKIFKAIEDYSLWLKIATKTDWYYLELPLVYYFDNPAQSIRSSAKSDFRNRLITYFEYLRWNRLRYVHNFIFTLVYTFKLLTVKLIFSIYKSSRS